MKHIILLALGLTLAMPLHAEEAKPAPADKPAGAEAKPAPAKPKHDPAAVFKKKDTDGDGFLTKEEFTAKAKDATKAETAFTRKDKNSDGKISLDEFTGKPGKGGKGGKKNK